MKPNVANFHTYLTNVPEVSRAALAEVRQKVKTMVPEAAESISYGMPTLKYRGKPLIDFGIARNHWALYGTSQGTVRFQHGQHAPPALVERLLRERVEAIDAAAGAPRTRRPRASKA